MSEFFSSLDASLLLFCNRTLANPLCDAIMPPITNWNQSWVGWSIAGVLWLMLFWKGGMKGRILALVLLLLVGITDQVSSTFIKALVARPRPCHSAADGRPIVEHLRLLVPCGSGFSFPSSHAVNNFALAAFMAHYYRRWAWAYFSYAALMGYSRLAVGVHYPSDVLGGAAIGCLAAGAFILILDRAVRGFPGAALGRPPGGRVKPEPRREDP